MAFAGFVVEDSFNSRARIKARLQSMGHPAAGRCFNSRARIKARPCTASGAAGGMVSTHAPVLRRDRLDGQHPEQRESFNSRARIKARRIRGRGGLGRILFQLTRPY